MFIDKKNCIHHRTTKSFISDDFEELLIQFKDRKLLFESEQALTASDIGKHGTLMYIRVGRC